MIMMIDFLIIESKSLISDNYNIFFRVLEIEQRRLLPEIKF